MAGEPAFINPPGMPQPGGHYSQIAVAGGLAFISGQLPVRNGKPLTDADFATQARQVLSHLDGALLALGAGKERLVQVRAYIDHIDHWPHFNQVYGAWIGAHRPARAVIPAGQLHFDLKIELEAVVCV
jgi:enamine deaminase RidA (YjgF/YER057c/UK114 family)